MSDVLLELDNVVASYGYGDILRGASLVVERAQVTCIIGPNGAGKSTLLKTISGLLKVRKGDIRFAGVGSLAGLSPRRILEHGIVQVAQDRTLFPKMTVHENVLMGGYILKDRDLVRRRMDDIADRFPIVAERSHQRAGALSGGQQRLVEIARACMLDPQLILLDEPTLGLDPKARKIVFETAATLCSDGRTVLMVEQNAHSGLAAAQHGVVMELGKVRLEAPADRLLAMPEVAQLYLGGASGLQPAEDGSARG